jgi:hypothetical protein
VQVAPFRLGIENQLIAVEAEMPNLLRADKIREPTSLNLMHNRFVDYDNVAARRQYSLANRGDPGRISCADMRPSRVYVS